MPTAKLSSHFLRFTQWNLTFMAQLIVFIENNFKRLQNKISIVLDHMPMHLVIPLNRLVNLL